jgi:DNA replication protein DnaC
MLSSMNERTTLPPRYSHVKYEDVPANIREKLKKNVKLGRGLYLFGDCGTGKTHIAYAIMKNCIEKQIRAKMYNSPEMLDVIRNYYGRKGIDYRDNELSMLTDYEGLLIIDDVGAEKPTEWVAETFYKIINIRYEKVLPTVFTSNYSLDQLAEKIGDRVPSRIYEMCEVVKLSGKDRRVG